MNEALKKGDAFTAGISSFVVDSDGKPGDQIILMDKRLRKIIQNPRSKQQSPYQIAIILAGTNDIFHSQSAAQMEAALIKLHATAHSLGVTRTIAVTVPEVGFTPGTQEAEEQKRVSFNTALRKFVASVLTPLRSAHRLRSVLCRCLRVE